MGDANLIGRLIGAWLTQWTYYRSTATTAFAIPEIETGGERTGSTSPGRALVRVGHELAVFHPSEDDVVHRAGGTEPRQSKHARAGPPC